MYIPYVILAATLSFISSYVWLPLLFIIAVVLGIGLSFLTKESGPNWFDAIYSFGLLLAVSLAHLTPNIEMLAGFKIEHVYIQIACALTAVQMAFFASKKLL